MRSARFILVIAVALALGTGLGFRLASPPPREVFSVPDPLWATQGLAASLHNMEQRSEKMYGAIAQLDSDLQEQVRIGLDNRERMQELTGEIQEVAGMGRDLYEEKIVALLGKPIGYSKTSHGEIGVFDFHKIDYRGYVAKVKPVGEKVIGVTGAPGKTRLETTAKAADRTGARLAINGGGFFTVSSGASTGYLSLGNTVIDGQLQGAFVPPYKDITFVGFDRGGRLIGGSYDTERDLMAAEPYGGVTFVPALIRDGEKLPLPVRWKNMRQPRTIVGTYPNGDVLFIVIDGRQSQWSAGVTLEEAQDVLIRLGIREAYNLDGGGSATMVFQGQVLNRPSDGRSRGVTTNIVVR